jgi:serine/threonine-protein kinase HipA
MTTKPKTRRQTFKAVDTIEVRIWNERVGAVTLEPTLGFYVFQYDPKFVRMGVQLAPLTMPLAQAQNPFVFTDLPVETYKRLPALLADALPDKFGNALITRWMTLHGVNPGQITELDRLAYMGKRGFGALEFKPIRGSSREPSSALQLGKLVESARVAVTGSLENDLESQSVLSEIIRVGTSAGGARAKAAIAWNASTGEIRAGQFEAPAGFEHWLLKFDGLSKNQGFGQSRDFGRVEYAYSLMAKAAGIEMSECQLLEENGRAHFMTKRFDRSGQQKHHLQTLCAISHLDFNQIGAHDYAQYFQTIQNLGLGYNALEQGFRRMVFNIMATNCDDHTKNFSFMLEQHQTWKLAPAYDLTFSYDPENKWLRQHLMSVNGVFDRINKDDCLGVAERFAIGTAPRILEEVRAAIENWEQFAKLAGVSKTEIKRIGTHHILL